VVLRGFDPGRWRRDSRGTPPGRATRPTRDPPRRRARLVTGRRDRSRMATASHQGLDILTHGGRKRLAVLELERADRHACSRERYLPLAHLPLQQLAWDSLAAVVDTPVFQFAFDQLKVDLDLRVYDSRGSVVGKKISPRPCAGCHPSRAVTEPRRRRPSWRTTESRQVSAADSAGSMGTVSPRRNSLQPATDRVDHTSPLRYVIRINGEVEREHTLTRQAGLRTLRVRARW
jgi:hypothetical protein